MLQDMPGSAPTKKPFTPSSSSRSPFERVDSRGSYQLAAATPQELRAGLESVGMRARMAVNKGYEVSNPLSPISPNHAHPASSASTSGSQHSSSSSRALWSRTQSAPSYAKELQPFSETRLVPPGATLLPYQSFLGVPSFSTVREDNEDARSVLSAASSSGLSSTAPSSWSSAASAGAGGTKRTAEDVLGGFMSEDDDDGSDGGDAEGDHTMTFSSHGAGAGAGRGETADENTFSSSNSNGGTGTGTARDARPNKSFPRRRGFAQTQTMPASMHTTRYLAGAAPRAQDDINDDGKWRQFRFEEYSKMEDF